MTATATAPEPVQTHGLISDVEVRSINEDTRTATFVAATENGVETWFGIEHLRIGGLNLDRYRKNPVVLDTHNRWEAGGVVGRSKVTVEKRELVAEITFAETKRAEEVWQLVKTKFLKTLSIGFLPQKTLDLADGEKDGRGQHQVVGPARVVQESELYEISVVPVPADPDTVRREFLAAQQINERLERLENSMPGKPNDDSSQPDAPNETRAQDGKPDDASQAAPSKTDAPVIEPTADELRRRDILAITPSDMTPVAERCILEGKTVEEARAAMLEELANRQAPAGTPEPEQPEGGDDKGKKGPEVKDLDDSTFVRSLTG